MALVNKTFSDIITFTRASTATFFNSAGVLTSAATNAPRFDYNPSTLAAQGLLIEESRANALTYSAEIDNAAWVKTAATVSANALTAPDGTVSADKLIVDNAVLFGSGFARQNISKAASAIQYTSSVFAKAGEFNRVRLLCRDAASSANQATVTVSLVDGSIVTAATAAGTFTGASSVVTAVNNGWYRISLTFTTGTETAIWGGCFLPFDSVATQGNGVSGIYIWGAQLEAGAFPTSYIPTTTTALTRAADVASVNTLSPWYNAAEGTLYAEAQVDTNRNYAGTFRHTVNITPTANSDSGLGLLVNTTNTFEYSVRDNSVTVAQLNTGTNTGVVFKIAGAYQVNNFAFSANGGTPVTDTSGAVPTTPAVTQMKIGGVRDGNALGQFNGYLRRITYYPRRLANAELQAITA